MPISVPLKPSRIARGMNKAGKIAVFIKEDTTDSMRVRFKLKIVRELPMVIKARGVDKFDKSSIVFDINVGKLILKIENTAPKKHAIIRGFFIIFKRVFPIPLFASSEVIVSKITARTFNKGTIRANKIELFDTAS